MIFVPLVTIFIVSQLEQIILQIEILSGLEAPGFYIILIASILLSFTYLLPMMKIFKIGVGGWKYVLLYMSIFIAFVGYLEASIGFYLMVICWIALWVLLARLDRRIWAC